MEFYILYFLIGLIVAVIMLSSENNKLKNENNKLKKELSEYKNGIQNENRSSNFEKTIVTNTYPVAGASTYVNNEVGATNNIQNRVRQQPVKKQTMSKEQSKNVMILVSGAILIVISALVFLMSTWNVIPKLLKTIVLLLLIGVFFGASQIADKKLKLKFTSATFFYLAMAYIPIMLISIWGFELLGKYLSIHGEGKYIYLTMMSIIVSVIYYIENKKRKGIALLVLSSIFQVLSVIFGVLIFKSNSSFVWLGISLYSVLIATAPNIIKNKKYRKYYKYYSIVIMIFSMNGLFFNTLEKWFLVKCEILHIVNWLLLALNITILKNNKRVYKGNVNLVLNEILNIAILFETITILNVKEIELISGAKLFVTSMVALLAYMFDYIKYEKSVFKIISYLLTNIVCLAVLIMLDLTEYAKYIPVVSTGITVLSEQIKPTKEIKYYIIVSFIVSFLTLNINPSIVSFLFLLVSIVAYKFYENDNKLAEGWDIVPAVAIIPSIYISKIFIIKGNTFNYAILLSLVLAMFEMMKSIKKDKINQNTIISLCYVILTVISFKINHYIEALLFVAWAITHITIHKNNKIYQPLLFIALLALYLLGINDLKINNFACTNVVGFIICTLAITRITLSEEKDIQKAIEYIAMGIIYLTASYLYKSVVDAMIVMGLMLALVVVGYMQKMGPVFLTSLIAIVINGLKLTKEFWLSIPWWIYLLVIGLSLILFAVNNEINQKENNQNLLNKLKSLKKEINM